MGKIDFNKMKQTQAPAEIVRILTENFLSIEKTNDRVRLAAHRLLYGEKMIPVHKKIEGRRDLRGTLIMCVFDCLVTSAYNSSIHKAKHVDQMVKIKSLEKKIIKYCKELRWAIEEIEPLAFRVEHSCIPALIAGAHKLGYGGIDNQPAKYSVGQLCPKDEKFYPTFSDLIYALEVATELEPCSTTNIANSSFGYYDSRDVVTEWSNYMREAYGKIEIVKRTCSPYPIENNIFSESDWVAIIETLFPDAKIDVVEGVHKLIKELRKTHRPSTAAE